MNLTNVQNHWLQLKSPKKYIKLHSTFFKPPFKPHSCQYQIEKLTSVQDLHYCYCCRHYYYHYYSCFGFLNVYYLLVTIHISFWLRVSYTTIHIINGLIMCIVVHETHRLKEIWIADKESVIIYPLLISIIKYFLLSWHKKNLR